MSLLALGDTHLSFGCEGKPMDIFRGWDNHIEKLEQSWRETVRDSDTVVIPGDISWAMSLEQAVPDFRFLDSLPGTKLMMKGNHDYWWSTMRKLISALEDNEIKSVGMIYNNAYPVGDFAVCGTRGWFFDAQDDADKKVVRREALRLKTSIDAARATGKEPIVFLHYPPLSRELVCEEIMEVLITERIRRCFYGHLHGPSTRNAFVGGYMGIQFDLVSADYLGFTPREIELF